LHKKVAVLEKAKYQQVYHDIDGDGGSGATADERRVGFASCPVDEPSAGITAQDSHGYQDQEAPVPPSVENVACRDKKEVLNFQTVPKYEPVQYKHDGKKDCKVDRVKQHIIQLFQDYTNAPAPAATQATRGKRRKTCLVEKNIFSILPRAQEYI
jgi:hypothetical protein